MGSADMSDEDSCVSLAELLATATSLTTFDIRYHNGRNISIKVRCATLEGQPGEVTVTDNDTE